MLIMHAGFLFSVKGLLWLILLLIIPQLTLKAGATYPEDKEVSPVAYDEIPVHVSIEGYKDFYVDAIYTKKKLLFINVEDLFKTLNIPCISTQKGNVLSGFVEKESQAYSIEYTSNQIKIGSRIITSKTGLIKEMGSIYMESSLFYGTFGINLPFNFSSLSIHLKSNFELPVLKQQRLEKLRSNMSHVRGEVIADTVLKRNYHAFKFGTLDWSAESSQILSGPTYDHFGLGIGAELLYGEADIYVNYYDQYKFDSRQLQYLWRWVDNDKKIIKQAQVGTISTNSISFLDAPVVGVVIRNSPTTLRKATGYYTINEVTDPDWIIELYINDVMVAYTKADASGSFNFKVPIVYGYNTLKMKFYGPMGEERTEERTINIPYTIMPARVFEYGLTAGVVQDGSSSRFGKGEFNYGVNRFLTVGGGMEYLSSIPNGPFIPFANATIQPFSRLILSGEYAYGVRSRGLLDYYFIKDALLEIEYNKYVDGQLATRFNAPEERKVKLSIPIRLKKFALFAKLDFTQLVYKSFTYNLANVMFSAYYKQFSANSSTQANWTDPKTPYMTTDLSLSYRLKNGFALLASAQYNLNENQFNTYRVAIEKNIRRGSVSISYEKNILFQDDLVSLNFRYDLPFAKTYLSVTRSKQNVNLTEGAGGSLAFASDKYIHASNNTSVGRGGISLYPFLDLNQNGILDPGEPMVKLNSVNMFGGRVLFNKKDSVIRISELNPFTSYILEFNDNDLENIAWRFKNKVYKVLVDPNQYKRIDIPIIPVGEVSGMVYRDDDNSMKGTGRIEVKFYKKNSKVVIAETLSESDGYIYYLGMAPGEYVARIDSVQLSNLGLIADPPQRDFTIKTVRDGDIIGGVDFVLRPDQNESPDTLVVARETIIEVPSADETKSLKTTPVLQKEQQIIDSSDKKEEIQDEPIPKEQKKF
jgi:hypothetical protein